MQKYWFASLAHLFFNESKISWRTCFLCWIEKLHLKLKTFVLKKKIALILKLELSHYRGFPGSSESKESACSVGDMGSIPGLGRSPGEGNGKHSNFLAWRIPCTEEPLEQKCKRYMVVNTCRYCQFLIQVL